MSLLPTQITRSAFDAALARYPDLLRTTSAAKAGKGKTPKDPETLAELDAWRLDVLPGVIQERLKDTTRRDGPLEKDDIERLTRWKLKHGKFRPTLLSLVQSNDESAVNLATSRAMDCLGRPQVPRRDEVHQAINELTALRGIGVATGSLLLSVILPTEVPFFSDEAFLWLMADQAGGVWDRKIKYTIDEYLAMWDAATALRERLGVGASEVERVGWVLGRERADLSVGAEGAEGKSATARGAARVGGAGDEQAVESKTADTKGLEPGHGSRDVAVDVKAAKVETMAAGRKASLSASTGRKRKGEGVAPVDTPPKRVTRSAKKG